MKAEGDRGACRARRDWTSFQPAASSTSPTHAASGPTRKSASASAPETRGLELNRAAGDRPPPGPSTTTSSEHKRGSGGGNTGPRSISGRGGWELGDEQRRPEGAVDRAERGADKEDGDGWQRRQTGRHRGRARELARGGEASLNGRTGLASGEGGRSERDGRSRRGRQRRRGRREHWAVTSAGADYVLVTIASTPKGLLKEV